MVRGLRVDNKPSFFFPRVLSKLAETIEVVTRRYHKLIMIIKVIINAHNMDQGLIELYSTSYVSPYQSCAILNQYRSINEKTLSNLISVRNPTQSKLSFAKNAHELIWYVVSPYRCNKRHNISLFCVKYDCECIEKKWLHPWSRHLLIWLIWSKNVSIWLVSTIQEQIELRYARGQGIRTAFKSIIMTTQLPSIWIYK